MIIAVDTKPHDDTGGVLCTPIKNKFQFPFNLHQLLDDAAKEGNEHIVSWLPHGKAFKVHSKKEFENEILPRYYSASTKYRSFCRQLLIYGFKMMKKDGNAACAPKDHGAYCHPLMSRGNRELCTHMVRVKIKNDRGGTTMGCPVQLVAANTTTSTNAAQEMQGLQQQHSPALSGGGRMFPHYETSHRVLLLHQDHYNCATNRPQVPLSDGISQSNTPAVLEAMSACLMPLQEQEGTADADDLLEFAIEANAYLDAAELYKGKTGCLPAHFRLRNVLPFDTMK